MRQEASHPYEAGLDKNAANFVPLSPIGFLLRSAAVYPQRTAVIRVDWQWPQWLPRRFRNHCAVDTFSGRPYCSDHCGLDYQFYLCSPASFGCCHIGSGYCDWNGLLRCHP